MVRNRQWFQRRVSKGLKPWLLSFWPEMLYDLFMLYGFSKAVSRCPETVSEGFRGLRGVSEGFETFLRNSFCIAAFIYLFHVEICPNDLFCFIWLL